MVYTPARPDPRRRRGWDIALSVVVLALGFVSLVVGSVFDLFLLAFTDYCPPATCHPAQGLTALSICLGLATLLLLIGAVVTIVLLVRRRRGWWVASIATVLVILGVTVGGLLYAAAVGYR